VDEHRCRRGSKRMLADCPSNHEDHKQKKPRLRPRMEAWKTKYQACSRSPHLWFSAREKMRIACIHRHALGEDLSLSLDKLTGNILFAISSCRRLGKCERSGGTKSNSLRTLVWDHDRDVVPRVDEPIAKSSRTSTTLPLDRTHRIVPIMEDGGRET